MTKLSLSFLVESDNTFTFFLDGKRQPLLSPLHQGFLLPGSMVMIPSFFKEFGEPPYQRPHCPPHLLYLFWKSCITKETFISMMEFSWMAGGRDKLEGWRRLNKAVSAPGTTSWKQIVYFWAFWVESYFLIFALISCRGFMIGAGPYLLFGQRQRACTFLSWASLKR